MQSSSCIPHWQLFKKIYNGLCWTVYPNYRKRNSYHLSWSNHGDWLSRNGTWTGCAKLISHCHDSCSAIHRVDSICRSFLEQHNFFCSLHSLTSTNLAGVSIDLQRERTIWHARVMLFLAKDISKLNDAKDVERKSKRLHYHDHLFLGEPTGVTSRRRFDR